MKKHSFDKFIMIVNEGVFVFQFLNTLKKKRFMHNIADLLTKTWIGKQNYSY
jgi:hypothetical protein